MSEEAASQGKRLTFAEFCGQLPQGQRIAVATPRPPELDLLEERPFVNPMLKEILEEAKPAVILIAARGAVGKTAFGREIARKAGTDVWALGQVQVGHRYLEGALAAAYGDDQFAKVTGELTRGERAIVLDGLDEALLRAGASNFDAFLESLAARFRVAGERPSVVLLGRTLAAEHAWDRLNDKGVRVSYYEIDYFDEAAARTFVELYIEQGRHRPHQTNRAEFDRARDSVLTRLRDAVPVDLDPGSIVGYAPVLRLVAELLDVGNPRAIAEKVQTWAPDELLRKVADGILTREQEEKVFQVPEYREAGAYRPDEQCVRLLARRAGHSLQSRLPHALPEHLREEYDRRVGTWINEHPFAREPIFEEYVHAWLLSRGDVGERGLGEALRHRLRGERPPYRPTPLLLRFASELGGGQVSVDAADFGFVYESALADSPSSRRGQGRTVKLTLHSANVKDAIVGEIVFPTSARASRRRVSLELVDSGQGLWFWRQLAGANISVGGEVRLGAGGGDFVLGPSVDLDCDIFHCDTGVVRVSAPSAEEQVVIEANSYRGEGAPEVASSDARPYLKVAWEGLSYPWSRYALSVDRVTPEVKEAFVRLRRILKPFRATVHFDELSCSVRMIDRIAGTSLASDILHFCDRKGLIKRQGDSYLLDRDVLDRLGISWEDLSGRVVSGGIASFLTEFSKRRS